MPGFERASDPGAGRKSPNPIAHALHHRGNLRCILSGFAIAGIGNFGPNEVSTKWQRFTVRITPPRSITLTPCTKWTGKT
jgi:hypothetical protein